MNIPIKYTYEHGGNAQYRYENMLDFSANINPLGLPSAVKNAVIHSLGKVPAYPDNFSKELRNEIAAFEQVEAEHIFCSNGASDIIFRLVYAIKPQKALVIAPTFLDYEKALSSLDCFAVTQFVLLEESGFCITNEIIDTIQKQSFDMVFICNPNNPTGCLTPKELVKKIATVCKKSGAYLVVDECFLDFVLDKANYCAVDLLKEYPNMIILKAFTKIFALAGMRLGYAILTDESLLNALYRHGADWPASVKAQEAGIAALQDAKGYIEKTLAYLEKEKEKIAKELEMCECKLYGSHANYLFFKSAFSFDLQRRLMDNYQIVIRACENYHGLTKEYYRIGIQKKEENQQLIQALKEIRGEA